MLKPTADRLDYGNLLSPPAGYEVVSAVGTTYSLDMDALIGICIAIGLAESTDSQLMKNPIYLLEALRKTTDKVVIFCEAGQIHVPSTLSSLYILLEKMIYQVSLPKQSKQPNYPSFHPKFWLIKYQDSLGNLKYRVVILSRNLTFDRSWDVSVALDGELSEETADHSQPLSDFLYYLIGFLRGSDENSKAKRKILNTLAKELDEVSFSLDNKIFTDFEFIPVGIKSQKGERYDMSSTPLFSETFHEVVIMSAFLTGSVIAEFNDRNNLIEDANCTLITRRTSLEELKAEQCGNFDIYTLKDTIVDGEDCLSDDSETKQKQDIHAKVYLWRKYSNSELYLGSLNASNSALNGNVEFVLRLLGKNRYLNATMLKTDLFNGEPDDKDNPFELTELPIAVSPESDEVSVLQNKIKELCRCKPLASVSEVNKKYNLFISFGKPIDFTGFFIAPLLSKKTAAVATHVSIEGLDILQLSEFYHITAKGENESVHRIIKITTDNLPEDRENAVVSSIIKDRQSFIQYIAFMLGDDYLLSLLENSNLQRSDFFAHNGAIQIPALYERMLRTAATSPERFNEIDYLMRMITGEDIIPEEFPELYETFKKAVRYK